MWVSKKNGNQLVKFVRNRCTIGAEFQKMHINTPLEIFPGILEANISCKRALKAKPENRTRNPNFDDLHVHFVNIKYQFLAPVLIHA